MRYAAVIIALVALAPAACSDPDPAAYRADLDTQCKRLYDFNDRLPSIQRRRGLTVGQASELARKQGRRFRAAVEELDPPGDLEQAHRALLDETGDPPEGGDLRTQIEFTRRTADRFGDLGAQGCTRRARRALEQIEQASGIRR